MFITEDLAVESEHGLIQKLLCPSAVETSISFGPGANTVIPARPVWRRTSGGSNHVCGLPVPVRPLETQDAAPVKHARPWVSIRVLYTCGPGTSIRPVAKYVGRWPWPLGRRSQQLNVFSLGGLPGPVEEAPQVAGSICAKMQECKSRMIGKYTALATLAPKKRRQVLVNGAAVGWMTMYGPRPSNTCTLALTEGRQAGQQASALIQDH